MVTIQSKVLQHPLDEGVKRARLTSRSILVSQVLCLAQIDPLSFFALGQAEYTGSRIYWSDSARTLEVAGLGATATLETEADERFEQAQSKWDALLQDHVLADASVEAERIAGTGPLLIGGFSFEPLGQQTGTWQDFGDGRLILPQLMVTKAQGKCWLTVNQLVHAGDNPSQLAKQLQQRVNALFGVPLSEVVASANHSVGADGPRVVDTDPADWKAAVAHASEEIRAGLLQKVVLARELQVSGELPFVPETVLARLREEQPQSYLFAVESGDSCFLGATPERLVKRENNTLFTVCLAGSTGRGKTPTEDLQLGVQLLQDAKNRIEHQFVVEMIRDAMDEVCDIVSVPDGPVLYKVRDLQHLATPVSGQGRAGVTLLSVVKRLHPTPALGGLPRAAALQRIRKYEQFQRGWYGAPVGWLDYRGNGEFSVAIRSGLLRGNSASVFAGCGIVGESDPDSEYEETKLKFKPILSALGVTDR